MSGPFHSLSISGSGMDVYQTWLDAIADNVANVSNVSATDEPAFQERMVIARAREERGGRLNGVTVDRLELGDPNGQLSYQPEHPLADADGMVRVTAMSLSDQMTHLIMAQRGYQANVSAFRTARDAYQRALEIGR